MIGLIVYFAEIASGLKVAGCIGAVVFGFTAIVLHSEAKPTNSFRIAGNLFLATALFGMALAVLVPTTEAAYKIAGVSSQEKARIDALGNVKP